MKRLVAVLSVAVVGFSPGVANGATALIVGGKGDYATLTDEQMSTALGGYFADDTRVSVPFPGTADFRHSTEVGAANLYQAIYQTPGPKIIGGVSEGVASVEEVLRRLMEDENRPGRDELEVVIYGRPNATLYRFGGVKYQPLPDTPYDILVVKAQYDGIADWPDNPFNLLAVMNALAGAQQLHVAAGFYDISTVPKEYISTTPSDNGGTTTTVLIPTPVLPLLKALADSGNSPELVKMLDSILRPIVDSAYRRPPPAPAAPTASQPGQVAIAEAGIQANRGVDGPFIGDAGRSHGTGHVDGNPGDDAGAQRKLRHAAANAAETGGERVQLDGAEEHRNDDAVGNVTGSGAAVVPERLDIHGDDDEADESGPEEEADNGPAATQDRGDSATDHAAPPTD